MTAYGTLVAVSAVSVLLLLSVFFLLAALLLCVLFGQKPNAPAGQNRPQNAQNQQNAQNKNGGNNKNKVRPVWAQASVPPASARPVWACPV